MKLVIEATEMITSINDVPCRLWKGKTEEGTECAVFVHRVVVREGEEAEFAQELEEKLPPAQNVGFDMRYFLP